ncbi:MAG: preprotein translocase subunit SecE [Chloroflexi bacterium]|nr:MAG: preprotein translocase subunit SecE [Chloroflexota bacterium]
MARTTARGKAVAGVSGPSGFSVIRFFSEVFSELRKVTWPTRQVATRLTLLVIALSATIGVFLGLIDMLFARVLSVISGT